MGTPILIPLDIQETASANVPTPASGYIAVYAESGKLKQKDSTGTVTDLTALGGGGSSMTYTAISTNSTASAGVFYGVDATSGDISITVNNGTSVGDEIKIKKLDASSNNVILSGSIDSDTSIIMSIQNETLDLYWNGTTYLLN